MDLEDLVEDVLKNKHKKYHKKNKHYKDDRCKQHNKCHEKEQYQKHHKDKHEDYYGYHKKHKLNWYPGKMLFKLFEAIAEIIGAILMIFLIARIFELDFTSIASVAGGIVAFLIIRFVIDELFG